MSDGNRLLKVLLKASEKAANIARICRQDPILFQLLVQEKSDAEKNPRFFRDFKTLADVLIQQTVKHDIGIEFPELADAVKGEESNVFSNTLGETITVTVCSSTEETTELLAKVLNNDTETASSLAAEVHRNIQLSDVPVEGNLSINFDVSTDDLGIWIDPIDSTSDYIKALEMVEVRTGTHMSGLRCVTVLIGVYLRSTGLPILGVINQPFCNLRYFQWSGVCYWGLAIGDIKKNSLEGSFTTTSKLIVLSRCEDASVKSKLSQGDFTLVEASGAGYKILSVIVGKAVAYILSKDTTYQWDTCAAQAVLRSMGGGIIDFEKFVNNPDSDDLDIKYSNAGTDFSNKGGIIAYQDARILDMLQELLLK